MYAVGIGPHRRGNMSRSEVKANKSTVTLHMVSSLDGFIAGKDNNIS
jgi:hypothetical protein